MPLGLQGRPRIRGGLSGCRHCIMVCRAAPAAGRLCQQILVAVLAFEGSCQSVLAAVLPSLQDLPQGRQVQGLSWTVSLYVQGRVQCRPDSFSYMQCWSLKLKEQSLMSVLCWAWVGHVQRAGLLMYQSCTEALG